MEQASGQAAEDYLRPQEVASRLKIPVGKVREAIAKGELKAAKIGRATLVRPSAVTEWLREKEGKPDA